MVIVLDQYHFGGYGKANNILDQFVIDFNKTSNFQIEQTYTGKALFAMIEYIKNKFLEWKQDALHSHGRNSLEYFISFIRSLVKM